jgi:hypothetical protein
MGPPPRLVKACEGKKDGDSCQVVFADKTLNGNCGKGRDETLVCRPPRH